MSSSNVLTCLRGLAKEMKIMATVNEMVTLNLYFNGLNLNKVLKTYLSVNPNPFYLLPLPQSVRSASEARCLRGICLRLSSKIYTCTYTEKVLH